jgi:hypothetical protein
MRNRRIFIVQSLVYGPLTLTTSSKRHTLVTSLSEFVVVQCLLLDTSGPGDEDTYWYGQIEPRSGSNLEFVVLLRR